jgi:hypothetical protein
MVLVNLARSLIQRGVQPDRFQVDVFVISNLVIKCISFYRFAANLANKRNQLGSRQAGCLLFAAGHRINFRRVVNGAVEIVHPEGKGQLGVLAAEHWPIGFEVREIVHI